ncbi:hypothetical protein FRC0546_00133 [Corynebacterium diphtheriae]|nr:hypothetical protein FRC0546_00133 [Corynebacterium diphtheriae]
MEGGADQGGADDFHVVVQGVEHGQFGAFGDGTALGVERFGGPHDGGDVEQELGECFKQRREVAVAGGYDAEEHGDPYAVGDQQGEGGDSEEDVPAERPWEDCHEDDPDHHVVHEEEGLFPDQAVDVDGERGGQLFDQAFVGDEDFGAFLNASRDEVPHD